MMTKMAFRSVFWFILILISRVSSSQGNTDLYLFSIQHSSDGHYYLYAPRFLSSYTEGGIILQPSFTYSGDILVSARIGGELQYDIWQLSPSQKTIKRLTQTKSNEFSPKMSSDGQNLYFIKQESADITNQQLYSIKINSGDLKSISGNIHDVNDYTWLSQHELGLCRIEGNDFGLSYLDIKDNNVKRITTSIGKKLMTGRNGSLIYIHKFDPSYWYIKKYDPVSSHIDVITVTQGRVDDFAMTADGTIFMGNESVLYSINPAIQTMWQEVADLSIYDIKFIKALAISDDGMQLALIAAKEKL